MAVEHGKPGTTPAPDHVRRAQAKPASVQRPATPAAQVLALQRAVGNHAVDSLLHVQRCGGDHSGGCTEEEQAPVQRVGDGLLDRLSGAPKALRFATDIVTDPSSLPRHLAAGIWAELSDETKAFVVDRVLNASKWLVENGPINAAGYASFMARLIQNAMIGFLDQAISYDSTFKIRIADRMVALLANPSPDFSVGFLIGFVKGLWDGVTGPFVLLYDIARLQVKIGELEGRLVAALANADQRKILVGKTQKLVEKVQALIGPALEEVLAGKSDPKKIIAMFDQLIAGAVGQAQGVGRSISDALVRFLQQPDRALGEGVGWVGGLAVFEILLLALTDGGYTAVKEAVTGVKWVAEALEAAARIGPRAEAALAPMFAALARFKTVLTGYRGLAGAVEIIEDIFALVVRFLKMSYGLEGAGGAAGGRAERGAAAAAEGAEGLGVRLERKLTNALGEPHEIKFLVDGKLMRCSAVCETIAASLRARAARLPPELQREAGLLVKRAEQLERQSTGVATRGLDDKTRIRELDALAEKAVDAEQRMSRLEQKAGVAGVRPSPPFTRGPQELDDLARDPAAAFQVTAKGKHEAQIGLDLENSGRLQGPIRRDIDPSRAEFLDGNNVPWDIKGFQSASFDLADSVRKVEAEIRKGENVILDLGGLTPTQATDLRNAVNARPDFAGKVIFWP